MPVQRRGTFCGRIERFLVLLVGGSLAVALITTASRAFDARRVEPSVYKIYSFAPGQNDQYTLSSGTGFLVSGRRYVVTNFHVVEAGQHFYIGFRNGDEAKLIEARQVDRRPGVDLALLEATEDLPGEPLKIGEYEPDKLADVVAIGFPGAANLHRAPVPSLEAPAVPLTDLDSTLTAGVISRMTFTNLKVSPSQTLSVRTVQHSSAINPGNSGGPLLDACGLVVGVNTLQGLNSQGLFFSVHSGEVARFLRDANIPFSATTRPCGTGMSSSLVALAIALTAAFALGVAAIMLRGKRRPPWREAFVRSRALLTALGQRSDKRYASPAPAEAREAGAFYLRPVSGGMAITLDGSGKAQTIGRGPGVDVVILDDAVSKVHARLVCDLAQDSVRITDLASSNGTYIDGVRIASADASPGALLRFGTVEYKLGRGQRSLASVANQEMDAGAWMLSGFDPSGRAMQFEIRPVEDPVSGKPAAATWSIGRDPARADFVIEDKSVSALHAEILYNPGEPLKLRDLGSMNGTRLDGVNIGGGTAQLSHAGHEIAFGLAVLRLSRLARVTSG